jgi:hypothetical protein
MQSPLQGPDLSDATHSAGSCHKQLEWCHDSEPPLAVVRLQILPSSMIAWLPASRFLGTLRDMGNEQHRFFLHAVAMIGGEPLAKVDMEAYM